MWHYQVTEEDVEVLKVTVIEGRGITVGWSDVVDTPDPYCKLEVPKCPNGIQRTDAIPNDRNPKWNKQFKFYFSPKTERVLKIRVFDEDFGFDDTVGDGEQTYDLTQLKLGQPVYHTFRFGKSACVDVKMVTETDKSKDLRYGSELCDDEKKFLEQRKKLVFKRMEKIFRGEQQPKNKNEVPAVAVMGSGGGFRAMCGLAGVFTALENHGLLDCMLYTAGLSGSTWYLSTLYSHPHWPGITCDELATEIKDRVDQSIIHLLTPSHLCKYFKYINKKRSLGYPVSFTDFFGCLVGDTLLKNTECRLSEVKQRVGDGSQPLPLCSAIHVEKDLSARVYSEWVEFSPFEYGMAKYGVFSKTEHFGGKFYKGRLIRKNQEQYLHYLQGIWGSAFTILLQRILNPDEGDNKDDGRGDLEKFCASDEVKHMHEDEESDDEVETDDEDGELYNKSSEPEEQSSKGILHKLSSPFRWLYNKIFGNEAEKTRKPVHHKKKEKDEPFWKDWLSSIMSFSPTLNTREGRAAETHNVFRGLQMSSIGPVHEDEKMMDTSHQRIFLVDAGLCFNSPYPLLLRPERKVQLILSFEFSQREEDETPPFQELLLAEEWARHHNVPFPPVKDNPSTKDPEVKELYIFEDKNDATCPIVMHFVLVNKTFREFKAPGVPRETDEEKRFGNFDVFSDPDDPYSSFKFNYTHEQFDRLYELTKFNTLLNIDLIKEKIGALVTLQRNNNA